MAFTLTTPNQVNPDTQPQPYYSDPAGDGGQPPAYGAQYSQPIQGQPIGYNAQGQPMGYSAQGQPMGYNAQGPPMGYNAQGQPIGYNAQSQPMGYNAPGQPMGQPGQPMGYVQGPPGMQPMPGVAVIQQPSGQAVVIISAQNPNAMSNSRVPVQASCTHCQSQVITTVEHQALWGTYITALILCCICPCLAWIPLVNNGSKIAVHKCPRCHRELGRFSGASRQRRRPRRR